MFVISTERFFKLFTSKWVTGIALFPFIILRHPELKEDARMLNHEKIHIRQQLELAVIPFFLWYIIEYVVRLIQYRDSHKAYSQISFEREAYRNHDDLHYLKQRKFWAFLNYL